MTLCPCRCGQPVLGTNTYASKGCGLRVRHRERPYAARTIHRARMQPTRPAVAPSWWVGLDRGADWIDTTTREAERMRLVNYTLPLNLNATHERPESRKSRRESYADEAA